MEEEEEDESPKTKMAVRRVEMEDFKRELEENRLNDKNANGKITVEEV